MCGICFVLRIPIESHLFNFDFLQCYNLTTATQVLPLNKHIQTQKLTLQKMLHTKYLKRILSERGPDSLKIHQIDTYKTNYEEIHIEQDEFEVPKNTAVGFQSTLHLRGDQIYTPMSPGSYFMFNGEIWDTGNLPPIDIENHENDGMWLHRMLSLCKGSKEQMVEMLRQIRGDFAIIMMEAEQIYIIKDYFGKRSLLLGMGLDKLVISSVPTEIQQANEDHDDKLGGEEQNEEAWKAKYEAEWVSSRNKFFFEVPSNSLICITLRNGEAVWQHSKIFDHTLKSINKIQQTEETVLDCTRKFLVESVKELTKPIKMLGEKPFDIPKMAVLFSGGIDSVLIVRILDLILPKEEPIDLVNLAFREDAPDRDSAKIAYEQLHMLNPNRRYNLILLNKTLADIEKVKKGLLSTTYPKTTHMDFNIATALHLASAATKSSIILTGLGADEIFSGYSRYRIAYKRSGYEEMENEMLFDMDRLWIRNLGRDDRAISMNAKEARYPFLYLPLWNYLRTVHLAILTDGVGEKKLLRKIAKNFGLEKCSTFKKRAIQFGTRLAKLSNVKSFGSNRKAKGTYEYK